MTPPRQMKHRKSSRGRVIGVCAGALLLLVAIFVHWFARGSDSSAETHVGGPLASASGHASASAPGARSAGPTSEPEVTPARPLPSCWTGLERLNGALTVSAFREAMGPLLAARPPDDLLLRFLKERLTEVIGGDEKKALEVLDAALTASAEELPLLLAGLRDAEAVHKPAVAQRLTELALDDKLPLERREELLIALETQRTLPSKALDGLAALAKDERSAESGALATRTLGRVMAEDFKRTGNAAPYVERLLSIAASAPEEGTRSMALEMPMVADVPANGRSMEKLGHLLQTDASENVRELAAHNLALGEDKKKALELYEQSFAKEQERCVRWALFRFAARAAGKQALPVMERMAQQDPRFLEPYRMFAQLYGSGVQDFERVWLQLPEQDPLGCLHEDGDET